MGRDLQTQAVPQITPGPRNRRKDRRSKTALAAQMFAEEPHRFLAGDDLGPDEGDQQVLGIVRLDLRVGQPADVTSQRIRLRGLVGDIVPPRQFGDLGGDISCTGPAGAGSWCPSNGILVYRSSLVETGQHVFETPELRANSSPFQYSFLFRRAGEPGPGQRHKSSPLTGIARSPGSRLTAPLPPG